LMNLKKKENIVFIQFRYKSMNKATKHKKQCIDKLPFICGN